MPNPLGEDNTPVLVQSRITIASPQAASNVGAFLSALNNSCDAIDLVWAINVAATTPITSPAVEFFFDKLVHRKGRFGLYQPYVAFLPVVGRML